MAFVVGLTGGIGCGKSTAAKSFSDLGASVIDTDAISHALTQVGNAGFQGIVQAFGNGVLLANGQLNRAKLRLLVFSDPTAKTTLESILHPMIFTQAKAALELATGHYTMIVVPLLFETGSYLPLIHRSLVIDCPQEDQIARTMARSQLSRSEVEAILAQQLPREKRLAQADDVIHNDQDTAFLKLQVRALHEHYLALSRESAAKP